jgi:hypothetical protein
MIVGSFRPGEPTMRSSADRAAIHHVMAELSRRPECGPPFMRLRADATSPEDNSPDVTVNARGRKSRIRVKGYDFDEQFTMPRWTCSANASVFPDVADEGDFVAVVRMGRGDGAMCACFHLIPTREVVDALEREEAVTAPDGTSYKELLVSVHTEPLRDYDDPGVNPFAKYRDAWHLLGLPATPAA